jgi:hypothetical protein
MKPEAFAKPSQNWLETVIAMVNKRFGSGCGRPAGGMVKGLFTFG